MESNIYLAKGSTRHNNMCFSLDAPTWFTYNKWPMEEKKQINHSKNGCQKEKQVGRAGMLSFLTGTLGSRPSRKLLIVPNSPS